jgi:ABC-type phosphate/phosphonate transport system substrate-binding protein
MNSITRLLIAGLSLSTLFSAQYSFAEADNNVINFITAPTHKKAITQKIYTPLTEYLSQKTGKTIQLTYPINYLDYTLKMRKGQYDITFDGPHFTSWRMKELGDIPVARLPGKIQIVVAVAAKEEKVTSLDQLAGLKVCAFPSPNLLTMAFLNHFENPIRQPLLVPTKGFSGIIECLKTEKGKAMVLRRKIWEKMDKTGFKLIAEPAESFPDRTFSVASRIDIQTQQAIREALLSPDAAPYLKNLLETFKKSNLVATDVNEYNGLHKLLNPLWGFNNR